MEGAADGFTEGLEEGLLEGLAEGALVGFSVVGAFYPMVVLMYYFITIERKDTTRWNQTLGFGQTRTPTMLVLLTMIHHIKLTRCFLIRLIIPPHIFFAYCSRNHQQKCQTNQVKYLHFDVDLANFAS